MVTLQFRQITIPAGQRVLLQNIDWREFEAILNELGENRGSRIAYYQKNLEIRMPLPIHEVNKEIIGDMIKIVLEELAMDNECFGSTTLKQENMLSGIEPDNCFYIQNYRLMIGKNRLNLLLDPPPDLAIEVDVTSKTQLSAYQALGVPELWIYAQDKLTIYCLENGQYIESERSPQFPTLPIIKGIQDHLEISKTQGRSQALRIFRQWVRNQNQ